MVDLRINGLSFKYEKHPVFSDVNCNISKGEVVSVVGRNGAGKSTLLKCINHILKPATGNVYINDKMTGRLSQIERAKKIGYLSQQSEYLFPTTVFDVVLTGRFPHSPVRYTKQDEEIVARILADMELSEFSQRYFSHLSGGEQQQVLIARALAQGADVLLFDEPTNNLDLKHQLQIMRLIRTVAKEKQITSIQAIHDLNLAAAFSDKIILMHKGRIFKMGVPQDVLTREIILECFDVHVKIYNHGGTPHIVMLESSETRPVEN